MVLSGDMVSGYACTGSPGGAPCAPGWFATRWRQLTAPLATAGVPYASILGNHDAEADLDGRQILQARRAAQGGQQLFFF